MGCDFMSSGIRNIEINQDFLYHRVTATTIDRIILDGGIRAKKYIKGEVFEDKGKNTANGTRWISLAKYMPDLVWSHNSSYREFIAGQYAFVIENVEAVKTEFVERNFGYYRMLSRLPINKRYSAWCDEYQVKDYIPLDKVVGIKIPNRKCSFSKYCMSYPKDTRGIDFFLEKMESVGGNFPFIDVEEKKIIEKDTIKEYIRQMR